MTTRKENVTAKRHPRATMQATICSLRGNTVGPRPLLQERIPESDFGTPGARKPCTRYALSSEPTLGCTTIHWCTGFKRTRTTSVGTLVREKICRLPNVWQDRRYSHHIKMAEAPELPRKFHETHQAPARSHLRSSSGPAHTKSRASATSPPQPFWLAKKTESRTRKASDNRNKTKNSKNAKPHATSDLQHPELRENLRPRPGSRRDRCQTVSVLRGTCHENPLLGTRKLSGWSRFGRYSLTPSFWSVARWPGRNRVQSSRNTPGTEVGDSTSRKAQAVQKGRREQARESSTLPSTSTSQRSSGALQTSRRLCPCTRGKPVPNDGDIWTNGEELAALVVTIRGRLLLFHAPAESLAPASACLRGR